ncbi:MAG: hypothetical protein IPK26_04435 [Planctomycetes bacterium]|nr:hypothetical protein [Planctomycetota bacterium]
MNERGFALLFMMILIGAAGGVFLLAVESFVTVGADRAGRAAASLADLRRAAHDIHVRTGTAPTSAAATVTAAGLAADRQIDPYGWNADFGWTNSASAITIRSRGEDRVLGNADDLVATVLLQEPGRASTRNRLRLLRAQLLRSPYRLAAGMSVADEANLRTWTRDYAQACRRWIYEPANQAALAATMAARQTQITNLCTAGGCPPLPASVTGVGGIMTGIGNVDARAFDGFQRGLGRDAAVGLRSLGADGATGSPGDDM